MSSTRSKRYWGTARVARMLQVTPATVANWIDSGHLKGHRTPTGHRRVDQSDLVDFLKSFEMPIPPELEANGDGQGDRPVVVVVDDEETYRLALARWVERSELGVELVEVGNGVDGLIAIGRYRPDLIVLDYRLPDLNATQLIERLLERERGVEAGAEVLVVTGGVTAEEEGALRRLGVRAIVRKDDGFEVVIAAMRQALSRRADRSSGGQLVVKG